MAKKLTTEEKIRESLLGQLRAQNKWIDYYLDLVSTYMIHWRLKEDLSKDVKENGLRVTVTSGNGFETEKPNTSIQDLQRETTIMLQILDKMDLRTPVLSSQKAGAGDGYL